MIDLRRLRDEPALFEGSLRKRGMDLDIQQLLALDEQHRALILGVESVRAEQNALTRKIKDAEGASRDEAIARAKGLSDGVTGLEEKLKKVKEQLDALLVQVPNLVHPDAPASSDELRSQHGETIDPVANPADHLAIGEGLGIIDVDRATKVSGSRFALLKGKGALLEMAIIRFALDRVMSDGFVPVVVPMLVREEAMFGTGFFPTDEAQIYKTELDDLYLIGTSEVPLASMHANEVLPLGDLPMSYAGYSSCFRREAGTYGKDTRGIIRLHQFEKVEMFVFCRAEDSEAQHARILALEESIFQQLEIPYRVMEIPANDLGASAYRKFDIEAWLPGSKRWLEVTSCSNCTDYQSRRLGIRTKAAAGNEFVHTLNGTAAAAGRAMVALLENHQKPDGGVKIPAALQPYTGFDSISKS